MEFIVSSMGCRRTLDFKAQDTPEAYEGRREQETKDWINELTQNAKTSQRRKERRIGFSWPFAAFAPFVVKKRNVTFDLQYSGLAAAGAAGRWYFVRAIPSRVRHRRRCGLATFLSMLLAVKMF